MIISIAISPEKITSTPVYASFNLLSRYHLRHMPLEKRIDFIGGTVIFFNETTNERRGTMAIDYSVIGNKIIMRTGGRLCETPDELLESDLFFRILTECIRELESRNSLLLNIFGKTTVDQQTIQKMALVLKNLAKIEAELIPKVVEGTEPYFSDINNLYKFVEYLYNFWRSYERYIIIDSFDDSFEKRPYRVFNQRIQGLTELIRDTYRDIQENITGSHPRIYRQLSAGAKISAICTREDIHLSGVYADKLSSVPMIRQVLFYPTLIFDPPMNKRTGQFVRIDTNPMDVVDIRPDEWLCYPAMVGNLLMHVYFHQNFMDLGFSLCNLFELAGDKHLAKKPDAIFLFGVQDGSLDGLAQYPTMFHEDRSNNLLIGACPGSSEFGYFGYLKKMMLTLHNAIMIRQGRLPFHGALYQIHLKNGTEATILMMGDSGAGKSETLEAFRMLGDEHLRGLQIIADDMGSINITEQGDIIGYGTETGAFIRLDDIKPGYAFRNIDRSIIMSPGKTNARIVLPVSTLEEVNMGVGIEYVLYANNYEEIDDDHPALERFSTPDQAFSVFREGTVMSKGTTTSKGIVHSYFANIFGPPQYREIYDQLARKSFEAFFRKGIFVGQIRTRLGIPGCEMTGPKEAALKLLDMILA